MTYRELLAQLQELTDAQLDKPVVALVRADYFSCVTGLQVAGANDGMTQDDLQDDYDDEDVNIQIGDAYLEV